jgi:hypothetical protein
VKRDSLQFVDIIEFLDYSCTNACLPRFSPTSQSTPRVHLRSENRREIPLRRSHPQTCDGPNGRRLTFSGHEVLPRSVDKSKSHHSPRRGLTAGRKSTLRCVPTLAWKRRGSGPTSPSCARRRRCLGYSPWSRFGPMNWLALRSVPSVPEPPGGMTSASRPSAIPSPQSVALCGARQVYPCPTGHRGRRNLCRPTAKAHRYLLPRGLKRAKSS